MSNNSIVDKIEFAIKYKVPCEVYYKKQLQTMEDKHLCF